MEIRIQKFLSEQGILSRRQAEKAMIGGKIKVNGHVVKELGTRINPETDEVAYLNTVIKPNIDYTYIIFYKPAGYTCTSRVFKGEKNIFELVKTKEKLFPIGRLDRESTGLMILTNDGNLAYHLTHPRFKCDKEYEVTLDKTVKENHLQQFIKGINIELVNYKIKKYKITGDNKVNIILTEGKKRHIRTIFEKYGYKVTTLHRIRIKTQTLRKLRSGEHREMTKLEVTKLNDLST